MPDITDVDVAIARTDPGLRRPGEPIEEIRHLYVDAIASAQRSMYLENQYFSSSVVGGALAARLRAPDAPEVVVVSRRTEEGWLEERTMGVLRARLHKQLQEADAERPLSASTTRTCPASSCRNVLNVHSKVIVVDDELVQRRLGELQQPLDGLRHRMQHRDRGARRRAHDGARSPSLRNRLLAEHLGTDVPNGRGGNGAPGRQSHQGDRGAAAAGRRTLEPINPVVSAGDRRARAGRAPWSTRSGRSTPKSS